MARTDKRNSVQLRQQDVAEYLTHAHAALSGQMRAKLKFKLPEGVTQDSLKAAQDEAKLKADKMHSHAMMAIRVLSHIPMAATLYDVREQKLIFWNDLAEELYGHTADEACSVLIQDLNMFPENDTSLNIMASTFQSGEAAHIPMALRRRKDGSEVPVELYCVPVMNEQRQAVAMIAMSRDISDDLRQKEVTKENAKRLERLNAEISLVAKALTHDMRVPVRLASTYANLAIDELEEGNIDEAKKMLKEIISIQEQNRNLIDGIATVAGEGSANFYRTKDDLTAFMRKMVKQARVLVKEVKGSVRSSISRELVAEMNASQLERVIQNGISNAISYRHHKRKVEIHIAAKRVGLGHCEITITDNGVGIPDRDDPELLLAAFSSGSNQAQRHKNKAQPSSGMGLAASQKIVKLHHGTLKISRREDAEGAVLTLRLPLTELEEGLRKAIEESNDRIRKAAQATANADTQGGEREKPLKFTPPAITPLQKIKGSRLIKRRRKKKDAD